MDYVIVGLVSLAAAALTLFSGFGLGSILTPVFAIYLPVDIAVAATAVVHLANNVFKLALIGRWAQAGIVLRFGLPAIPAALLGAWVLVWLSGTVPLASYALGSHVAVITPAKLVIAALIAVFAIVELVPGGGAPALGARWLPLGGAVSGFLGGMSGHQGAIRSAFLLKAGLDHRQYVGTNTVIAVMVDLSRLTVYGFGVFAAHFEALGRGNVLSLAGVAMICAFAGSFWGARLVHGRKVTLTFLRYLVAVMLVLLAAALGAGVI